jgi:hypothetical protein
LLNCIQARDYALISRHLGLSNQVVETHVATALCEIARTIDLIERASRAPLSPDGGRCIVQRSGARVSS